MPLYGYRFDRDAEGVFYVKQKHENGETEPIPDVAQDHRRFATWQEAKVPADKWAANANNPTIRKVCNPQYQERRLDGVMAHLEYDPKHGTILVRDTECKERESTMPRYTADELRDLPTIEQGQADDLKVRDGDTKVWLSRMTVEDGMPYNDQVTIERLVDGRWITIDEYAG